MTENSTNCDRPYCRSLALLGFYPLAIAAITALSSDTPILILSLELWLIGGSWLQELLADGITSYIFQFGIVEIIAIAALRIPAILHPNPAKATQAPEQPQHRPESKPVKLATLTIGEGDFASGFPVIAQIWQDGHSFPATFFGKLPPAADIPEIYDNCQYFADRQPCRIKAIACISNFSPQEARKYVRKLEQYVNSWLESESFRPIADKLREKFQPEDELLLLIRTENSLLQRLPWHAWSFFDAYPRAQYALGALGDTGKQFIQPKALFVSTQRRLRILAVFGNAEGIDIQPDREAIANFAKAEVIFLEQPTREKLNQYLWDEGGWDMFCFFGHSSSSDDGTTGTISLNQTDKLAIEDLKYALKGAIFRGLGLAIFNSCDGLGLAKELADLHIAQAIVMREPVPDFIAQAFLKHLLEGLASSYSLPLAVRQAREKLQYLETDFPSATWLPAICQNRIWE